ncbi:hypothetical protein [Corynebacterium sp. TAE3-ERU2]|uniref:hypothetical protein n=1 Tax=Corynebacterium sp. TAE3-ERU2 TaxID=2849497 RepID=UPI001C461895|nr:hypothetical protein [Corynebacterium sp. TAE3-ERU2]MBV7302169.1 hypothetical protein [Corynebacterium sp. TAE3-ERU2]
MQSIHGHYEWDETVGIPGHRDDGSLHQNLYNEDGVLTGHARFVPDEDQLDLADEQSYENTFVTSDSRRDSEESNELAKAIAGLIVVATIAGVATAAPHVKQWWKEKAWPNVNSRARRIRIPGRKKKSDAPEAQGLDPAHDEHDAIERDQRQIMSRQEAMARTIAGLAAKAYSDEQLRMVKSAQILDVEEYAEIEQALAQIPSEQLQALITEMVKSPALLEDGSLANLASMLNPSNQYLGLTPEPSNREDPEI